ncbi:hypothetical protein Taro_044178 [Colocasia esculenta]|uniref:Uncharacterized protein n=1 Tax=Colocasia esculenta TaxID=4460 RepID=A0A843X0A4_COLES|nr:hypothetical protein [Colocasia esculenta]
MKEAAPNRRRQIEGEGGTTTPQVTDRRPRRLGYHRQLGHHWSTGRRQRSGLGRVGEKKERTEDLGG